MSRLPNDLLTRIREEWGPEPLPRDFRRAAERFAAFTEFTPDEIGEFGTNVQIPREVYDVGEADWVSYRSDKWGDGWHNYIHDHDPGVRTCLIQPPAHLPCRLRTVPSFLRNAESFTMLGGCIGFGFCAADWMRESWDEEFVYKKREKVELYCTPNGRALLVIVNKRKLVAMMWGGKLDVENRGIVG